MSEKEWISKLASKGLGVYLVAFLALNLFGLSFLSSSVWAPYTCNFGGSNPWSITSSCDIRGTINPSSVEISNGATVRIADGNPATWLKNGGRGFYDLDSGSGSIAYDGSGYNNDGDIYGATWASGRYGNALSFDGAGDYIQVPDAASLDYTGSDFSVSFWFYLRQGYTGNWRQIFVKGDGSARNYAMWMRPSANDIHFRVDPNNQGIGNTAGTIPLNQWVHIAGVYDSSAGTLTFYLDGVQDTQATGIDMDDAADNNYPLYIGDSPNYNGVDAKIDEFRVYKYALPQKTIKDLAGQRGKLQMDFLTDYLLIQPTSKLVIRPDASLGP